MLYLDLQNLSIQRVDAAQAVQSLCFDHVNVAHGQLDVREFLVEFNCFGDHPVAIAARRTATSSVVSPVVLIVVAASMLVVRRPAVVAAAAVWCPTLMAIVVAVVVATIIVTTVLVVRPSSIASL